MVDYIKKTIAQNFTGTGNTLVPDRNRFSLDAVPDLTDKVALVTGGSEGIGYGCTHTLLSHNISKLFILSPSKEVIDGAVGAITEELGSDTARRVRWLQLDLSDWAATAKIADQITKETDRLDIVVNNAARGIMTAQKAANGIDLHMAINHFGHAVLTSHLMPLLKKTADAGHTVRIVNLGSNVHQSTPTETKFQNVEELNKDYGPNAQYARSKLAAILYARFLARHLTPQYPNILVNATHPGIVETRQSTEHIHEPYPLGGYAMSIGLKPFKKDQFEGAISTMFAATATDKSGEYICPPAVPESGNDKAQDEKLGEQLMALTKSVVEQKTGDSLKFY